MRRFCCLLLCLLLTLSLVPARTEALEVSAAAAVLMDADTGEILFEKNADRRMLIASTHQDPHGSGGARARAA